MARITQGQADADQFFNLDGLDHQKGLWEIYYASEQLDDAGVIDETTLRVGIRSIRQRDTIIQSPILVSEYENGSGISYTSLNTLIYDLGNLLGVFSLAGESTALKTGFIDYNDTTGAISLTANTWTDIPNNGLGAFSNSLYKPDNVNDVLDTSTGYLDFSELTLGSELIIRNDFKVNPSTNNALLEVRYLLGQGAGEYPLLFWSERLDNGSGIDYQRVLVFAIYMGDTNTQGGAGKLQIKLSTNGTLTNAGSYISIKLR